MGGFIVQEPLLAASPGDSGVGAVGAQQGGARQIRGMAKPRSIAGSMYTLARSMRIFPTALSPHRCLPGFPYCSCAVAV